MLKTTQKFNLTKIEKHLLLKKDLQIQNIF